MNYYNYFTEVEDRFRQARDSGMFLMSPLDWALIEYWKTEEIPLEAVLKGIDRAFEKWHSRRRRFRKVNSLAYCAQEVMKAAKEMSSYADVRNVEPRPSLEAAELAVFLRQRAMELHKFSDNETFELTAVTLDEMAKQAEAGELHNLQVVEQKLTVLEDRVFAAVMLLVSDSQLLAARQELESQLAPYRSKMTAEQVAMLEQRYMRQQRFEEMGVSRLSLFYAS